MQKKNRTSWISLIIQAPNNFAAMEMAQNMWQDYDVKLTTQCTEVTKNMWFEKE